MALVVAYFSKRGIFLRAALKFSQSINLSLETGIFHMLTIFFSAACPFLNAIIFSATYDDGLSKSIVDDTGCGSNFATNERGVMQQAQINSQKQSDYVDVTGGMIAADKCHYYHVKWAL